MRHNPGPVLCQSHEGCLKKIIAGSANRLHIREIAAGQGIGKNIPDLSTGDRGNTFIQQKFTIYKYHHQ
jgi:hypothetical protein